MHSLANLNCRASAQLAECSMGGGSLCYYAITNGLQLVGTILAFSALDEALNRVTKISSMTDVYLSIPSKNDIEWNRLTKLSGGKLRSEIYDRLVPMLYK